ncbi:MAG: hypothetical protein U0231_12515 [Nitrospiraceae bacterium]
MLPEITEVVLVQESLSDSKAKIRLTHLKAAHPKSSFADGSDVICFAVSEEATVAAHQNREPARLISHSAIRSSWTSGQLALMGRTSLVLLIVAACLTCWPKITAYAPSPETARGGEEAVTQI